MMIAAAATKSAGFQAPFGWFDVLLIAVLAFGLFRGRKNGMTKEMLPTFQWIAIVLVGGLGYEMVGQFFVNSMALSKLWAYILGYLSIALVVFILFQLLKKLFQARLTGSNFFGNGEYYLGMIFGLIRYACILLFALALLNARFYTSAEIAAHKAYVDRWFGSDFFPDLRTVQDGAFKESLIGPFIKEDLSVVLINSVPPAAQKAGGEKKPSTGTITIIKK